MVPLQVRQWTFALATGMEGASELLSGGSPLCRRQVQVGLVEYRLMLLFLQPLCVLDGHDGWLHWIAVLMFAEVNLAPHESQSGMSCPDAGPGFDSTSPARASRAFLVARWWWW